MTQFYVALPLGYMTVLAQVVVGISCENLIIPTSTSFSARNKDAKFQAMISMQMLACDHCRTYDFMTTQPPELCVRVRAMPTLVLPGHYAL